MINKFAVIFLSIVSLILASAANETHYIDKDIYFEYKLEDKQSKTVVVFLFEQKTSKELKAEIEKSRKHFADAGYSTLSVSADFTVLLKANTFKWVPRFFNKIQTQSYCDNFLFCGYAKGGSFALKYAESFRGVTSGVIMLPGFYLPSKPLKGLNVYSRVGSKDALLKHKNRMYDAIKKQGAELNSAVVDGFGRTLKLDWPDVQKWLLKAKIKVEKVAQQREYLSLSYLGMRSSSGPAKKVILDAKEYAQLNQLPAGRRPSRHWQLIKWDEKYTKYIEALKKSKSINSLFNLAVKCEKANMPTCAEHVYRQILVMKTSNWQKDPAYKKALANWIKLNDHRVAPDTYSLPMKNEFYPIIDKSGHHRWKHWAAEAYDFVYHKSGRSFKGSALKLENHYSWAKPVVAIADGIILSVVDKNPDVRVGMSGGYYNANTISLGLPNGMRAGYGHLKQGSIKVKVGQRVKKGQILGLIGNSGASGSPHLHFDITDIDGFALKGLFNFQEKRGNKWVTKKSSLITEGLYIKPLNN